MPSWPVTPSAYFGPPRQRDPDARPDDAARRLAQHLEVQVAARWVVMWRPHAQCFTAIWKGPSPSGIECGAPTPEQLWDLMAGVDAWLFFYTDGPELDGLPEADAFRDATAAAGS